MKNNSSVCSFTNLHWVIAIIIFISLQQNGWSQTVSLSFMGHNRSCIVQLPSGYSASNSYPLVLNLHGYNSAAWQQQLYCKMDAVADTAKFIVAYPDAFNGAWDTSFTVSSVDDPGFINALLDKLITLYSINQNRVYACGLSMGGFMTYRIATEIGHRFAAVASVAGPTTDSVLFFGNTAPVIPVMHIHGTSDSNVPYEGTALFHPVDSTIQYFIRHNNCGTTPLINALPDINAADSCSITTYCYSCTDSNEVLFYKVNGGGHSWPGGFFAVPQLGNMNTDINGSAHIWNFFNRHQRKEVIQDIDAIKTTQPISIYPNPTSGLLSFELPKNLRSSEIKIEVIDMTGKVLQQKLISNAGKNLFSLKELQAGIYIFRVTHADETFQSLISLTGNRE